MRSGIEEDISSPVEKGTNLETGRRTVLSLTSKIKTSVPPKDKQKIIKDQYCLASGLLE